ncbi:MAG: hypothetical protein HZC45_03815 [Deltaproteobacteria bacterium]|nr:hypothetical protein [Deltaproteobacteria bacterium]
MLTHAIELAKRTRFLKDEVTLQELEEEEKGGKGNIINNNQYFEGIAPEVWEYRIGGYQVLDKWLKDRKDRELSLDDIKHYCRIITALQKTIETQKAIDDSYSKTEEKI